MAPKRDRAVSAPNVVMPFLARANGLWGGPEPPELEALTYAERKVHPPLLQQSSYAFFGTFRPSISFRGGFAVIDRSFPGALKGRAHLRQLEESNLFSSFL